MTPRTVWNSPGQDTGVGSLSLLQGIFPTQGLNPGLPHCGGILYHLSHKGRPHVPLGKNKTFGISKMDREAWRAAIYGVAKSQTRLRGQHTNTVLHLIEVYLVKWRASKILASMKVNFVQKICVGFSRQECCSVLPFPSPGDLPYPGIEPRFPALQADA